MRRKSSGASKKKKVSKPTSPPPRTGHVMVSDDAGRVVVTGGYSDTSDGFMDVWSHSPSTGWACVHESTRGTATPLPRTMAASCMLDGCLYLFGGMQQEGSQMLVYNDLWQFNLATCQWRCVQEEVAAVSERSGAAMVPLPGARLLLHGGECLGRSLGDCFLSCPLSASSQSASFGPLQIAASSSSAAGEPCARACHCLCLAITSLGDSTSSSPLLVLFGGATSLDDGDTVYHNDAWTLSCLEQPQSESGSAGAWQWAPLQQPSGALAPSPRSMCAALPLPPTPSSVFGGILLFGGLGLVEKDATTDCDSDSESEDGNRDGGDEGEGGSEGGGAVTQLARAVDHCWPPSPPQGSAPLCDTTCIRDDQTSGSSSEKEVSGSVDQRHMGEEEEKDEDRSVAEGYLDDFWLLDVSSGAFCAIDLALAGRALPPLSGCTLAEVKASPRPPYFLPAGGAQQVLVFGGFGGAEYAGDLGTFSTSEVIVAAESEGGRE